MSHNQNPNTHLGNHSIKPPYTPNSGKAGYIRNSVTSTRASPYSSNPSPTNTQRIQRDGFYPVKSAEAPTSFVPEDRLFIFTERAAEAYNAALSAIRNGGSRAELMKLLQMLEQERAVLTKSFLESSKREADMIREGIRVINQMLYRLRQFLGAGAPLEASSSASSGDVAEAHAPRPTSAV